MSILIYPITAILILLILLEVELINIRKWVSNKWISSTPRETVIESTLYVQFLQHSYYFIQDKYNYR